MNDSLIIVIIIVTIIIGYMIYYKHSKRKAMQRHLVYMYYSDCEALNNIGLTFDSKYVISFDSEKSMLCIKSGIPCPKDFWGELVCNVSVIVGNNGAGKTTAMRHILNHIVDGRASDVNDDILVYADDDSNLTVCTGRKLSVNSPFKYTIKHEDIPLKNICYSSHITTIPEADDSLGYEFRGNRNISEGWLLFHDIERATGIDSSSAAHPYALYLTSHHNRDEYRTVRFIHDKGQLLKDLDMNIPEYLKLSLCSSGYEYFGRRKKNVPPFKDVKFRSIKDKYDYLYFYNTFLNVAKDHNQVQENWLALAEEFVKGIDVNKDAVEYVKSFNVNSMKDVMSIHNTTQSALIDTVPEYFAMIISILETIRRICKFDEIHGCYYISIKDENIETFFETIYPKNVLVTSRFFEIQKAFDLDKHYYPSAGEKMVLNLMSRLYEELELSPFIYQDSYSSDVTLIILDEAEVGYHPEWQRKFLKTVLDFTNSLPKHHKYQILLTTHSPIILSDIPGCNVSFLKNTESGTIAVSGIKTFGANIYDLLKESFFLSNSIGDYAQSRISEVFNTYYSEGNDRKERFISNYDTLKFIVDNIADDYIHSEAQRCFDEMSLCYGKSDDVKHRLEKEISQLTERLAKLNEQ